MTNWEPYLETYKPAFANAVVFQELTLGSIAPHLEGLVSTLNNFVSMTNGRMHSCVKMINFRLLFGRKFMVQLTPYKIRTELFLA